MFFFIQEAPHSVNRMAQASTEQTFRKSMSRQEMPLQPNPQTPVHLTTPSIPPVIPWVSS